MRKKPAWKPEDILALDRAVRERINFNPEPISAERILEATAKMSAQGLDCVCYAHPETIDDLNRRIAKREGPPVQRRTVRGGSSPVSRISLAGDEDYGRGYDAIFGAKEPE